MRLYEKIEYNMKNGISTCLMSSPMIWVTDLRTDIRRTLVCEVVHNRHYKIQDTDLYIGSTNVDKAQEVIMIGIEFSSPGVVKLLSEKVVTNFDISDCKLIG